MALARIEEAIMRSSSTQAPPATASEVAAVRLRFAAALAKLQETQVRYDNGMVTSKAMADALLAAAAVWDPAAPTQVPTPALSDAALLESLKATTSIASESARADALLDLARRYAFTPAMVTAYVAAANSIKNDAERARVFAQSIRVKSPGGEWYFQRPR
jgi:hypothetical protein